MQEFLMQVRRLYKSQRLREKVFPLLIYGLANLNISISPSLLSLQ